jgi:hypothetical protein
VFYTLAGVELLVSISLTHSHVCMLCVIPFVDDAVGKRLADSQASLIAEPGVDQWLPHWAFCRQRRSKSLPVSRWTMKSCVLRLEEVIMDLGFVDVEFGEAPCQCVVKPSATITVCFFVQIAAKLGGHIIRGKRSRMQASSRCHITRCYLRGKPSTTGMILGFGPDAL